MKYPLISSCNLPTQGPTIESQFKTQCYSIQNRIVRTKLARDNNHHVRSCKLPEKSCFAVEHAAIHLQQNHLSNVRKNCPSEQL
jgi:hypothetical protein